MKNNRQTEMITERLPLIALRGFVVFPNTVVTVDVARERSLKALKQVMEGEHRVFLVAQRDSMVDHPDERDLFIMGTVATVRHATSMQDKTMRVLVEGNYRALLTQIYENGDYQEAEIADVPVERAEPTSRRKAMMRTACTLTKQLLQERSIAMPELIQALEGEQDAIVFCDVAAAAVLKRMEDRQAILECRDVDERLSLLLKNLAEEKEIILLEEKIQQKVRESMERNNHEYYLREQIRVIQEELGDGEDEDIAALRRRLAVSKMHDEARERVEKELKRLSRTAIQAPESSVSENYIEYMLELPWEIRDEGNIDIARAKRVLEEDHFGMREVKERLIEYLAVRSVTEKLKSPILCLVGPPGVGKTSIVRSVARALNRKFVQMSLGGLHDEAEIRGHRKTYVGAMPGRIIASINQCKTMNPVFLLDEIDKMAHDFRGDPASAMLEALDPEQNQSFRDHYLETSFDLSDVLFITTANTTQTIDRALLDRMEVIEVPSYTLEEKLQIAKRHLIPKQMEYHGMKRSRMRLSEKTLKVLIDGYTRESGVRTLERLIGKLCRKVTVKSLEDQELGTVSIRPGDLKEYLGGAVYTRQSGEADPTVGVVNGLAWTSVGGEVMPIEVIAFPGKDALELTGNLGDVMKESARIARSAVRERLADHGLETDYFSKHDLHIHVPEGAVPKDGPSAGVALVC
ncbi:MAG: endopeptidase La, partial [Christensenellales bacterium]|nr:endopeptidase La [Christensenellales bacterium]